MSTLASHITDVAQKAGYAVDSSIVGSTDVTTIQLLAWAQEVIHEMSHRYEWPILWKSYVLTTVPGQGTYPLPGDFSYYHYDTFWNEDSAYRIYGPINPQDFASYKGSHFNPPRSRFMLQGMTDNELKLYPTPADAATVIFEYQCARPVKPRRWAAGNTVAKTGEYCSYNGNYYTAQNTGTTGATAPTHTSGSASDGSITWTYYDGAYERFLADTDEPVLPELPFQRGVFERFAEVKGLTFDAQFDSQVEEHYRLANPMRTVFMDGPNIRKLSAFAGKVAFGRWYE